ncbi:PepSY-associated TM helix domain-containing protein [Arcobacter cryaerophilus gv. pseudocryaerophilus]|uniref:PepSY-associated TM helix domain-containing protein n=3 Tax=unclassified Arcobacter TaxID=2593671 RepID=A0AA96DRH3_9BACT|nr:PepSY-associated TM helix domain-containing protein [Arcobacter sp. AZ-2023]WPD06591.1 PepSY-associated TM helix domain-containing protein [Arcobacter sp. DSM 115956]WPD08682.1 PepSY-associated TM helix domain-containing protein [Arcobacter sp. DSM 115955]WNL32947.1 PepSY-associated TM helix domain-containing protein [Arcobacter sp. AZ-2023]WNP39097.1 PepSY-associated TM helix domain-containing protein [Arcobacter sp. AZ-2023]
MHKTFWFQLHWFFGFVFGILLLLIGVSGAVLSYEKEILQAINKDTYFVNIPQDKQILSTKEILEKYQTENPDSKINSISFSSDKSSSVVLNIASKDPNNRRGESIYINPYTAEVLPQIEGKDFFMFFFKLHRWLTFEGDTQWIGKNAVALATIACIILTIGGVIVYWSRVKNNFLKSFTFSFKSKNRAFLSTMHSAIGMWVVPFFLLMCFTGLYWSYDWYRSAMFTVMQVEQLKRAEQLAQTEEDKEKEQNKTQNNDKSNLNRQNKIEGISYENAQKVADIFNQNVSRDYKNANLRLTPSKDGIYTISYLYADATHFRESNSMEIDPNKSIVVKEAKFEDKKLNEQLMSSMLPLHSGEYFGWIGQLLMFIASSLMALFVITGYMLYFDRWKKKRAKALKEKQVIL